MSLINDMLRDLDAKRPDDPARRGLQREVRSLPLTVRKTSFLARLALLAVYGEGRHAVKPSHVRQAAGDTEGASFAGWW